VSIFVGKEKWGTTSNRLERHEDDRAVAMNVATRAQRPRAAARRVGEDRWDVISSRKHEIEYFSWRDDGEITRSSPSKGGVSCLCFTIVDSVFFLGHLLVQEA